MGKHISYEELLDQIDRAAACLRKIGFKTGDVITICLPNVPHAVVIFYAVNRIGGICNMVHPLTTAEEMSHYIRTTRSDYLLVLDAMLEKHLEILPESRIRRTHCLLIDGLSEFWIKSDFL